MITIKKKVYLDAPIKVEALNGETFTNENAGHEFIISCMSDGVNVALTGTISCRFMRANNTTIYLGPDAEAGYNTYTSVDEIGNAKVILHPDCYNVPGRFQMAVFETSNSKTTCIYACVGNVRRTEQGELIDSGEVVPSLDQLIEMIDECVQATQRAEAVSDTVDSLEHVVGATETNLPKNYTRNNANISNIVVGRNGKDIAFDVGAVQNGIGVYSATLFYTGKTYIVEFDIAASASGTIKINTDFGVVTFENSGHFDFIYTPNSNKANIFYMNGTANPLCRISITNFTVFELIEDNTISLFPRVLADEQTIIENAEREREVKNCVLIGLNGGFPQFEGTSYEKIIFDWGSASVYVVTDGGTSTSKSFNDIYNDIPNYAVVDGTKITITMPNIGVFGYNTETNHFVMQTNYNLDSAVKPLYYRYYQVCFGMIAQMRYVPDYQDILNNRLRMVYTTNTARHTIEKYGSAGGVKIHVGNKLNVRFSQNWQGELNWEDISEDITENIIINGNTADIIVPNAYRSLVLNLTDHKLHIRNLQSVSYKNVDDVVLLQTVWSGVHSGVLYNEYIDRMVEDWTTTVTLATDVRNNTFNSSYHTGAGNFITKCTEFSSLLLGTTPDKGNIQAPVDFETFLFFTDPHLLESNNWQSKCYEFMTQIEKYYNSTPVSFCLCGGDWLGNGDLPDTATFKMGYINAFMRKKFGRYYMLVGNHDTNYQGKQDASSANYTTCLSNQSISDLWYRDTETQKAYYVFDGCNTRFYCFDTGIEGTAFTDYRAEQATWFANALLTDNSPHIAMSAHIFYNAYDSGAETNVIHPLTAKIFEIAQAYNSQGTIEVDGETYNFAGRTGKVEFFIGGHTHADLSGTLNGIPWILTTWVRASNTDATFDLVAVNYDKRKIHLVRVGDGESRTINL